MVSDNSPHKARHQPKDCPQSRREFRAQVSITDYLNSGKSETYGYNSRNMLASATGPYGVDTFTYDSVGNITSHVNVYGGVTTTNTASYAATDNRMASIAQNGTTVRTMAYDLNGNISTDTIGTTVTTYSYGHADRMYAMAKNGSRLGEYYYNAYGQLVHRIITNTVPTGWTIYLYDQAGHPIAEYDKTTGTLLREYVWLGDMPLVIIEPGTTISYRYIHIDQVGRPIALTDATGAFVNQSTFVVYGNLWASTGSASTTLRFEGQMAQFESGLYYNWNRQYDPSIARYTQPDPLGLVDGPSRYAYVGNDPLQKVDPSGMQAYSGQLPPGNIPGGPWTPAGLGQQPGTFYGPKNPLGGPRLVCRYVPDRENGGPADAKQSYWKTKAAGDDEWKRYNNNGEPISPEEAHPNPFSKLNLPPSVSIPFLLVPDSLLCAYTPHCLPEDGNI